MLIQGQVGPNTATSSIPSGTQVPFREGNMGEIITSELQGRYYESSYRRTNYTAATNTTSTAVATVVIGTTSTYTGLILSNPVGSTVNLVLNKATWAASIAVPTAGFIGIGAGYNSSTNVTHTSSVTPTSNFVGVGASGIGLADYAANIPTACTWKYFLSMTGTQATTAFNISPFGYIDLEGGLILPTGAYAAFFTFAANSAAWWLSMQWEEVAI